MRITKADLERENQELKDKINDLYKQIEDLMKQVSELRSQKDDDFSSSSDKMQMEKDIKLLNDKLKIKDDNNKRLVKQLKVKCDTIQELIIENEELKKENEGFKVNAPVEIVHKHNERGAGRKNKFTNDMIDFVVNLKNIGYTYLEIKQKFWEKFGKSISVGSISSIIKENS